jgi:Integron cassette protein VCH_CASS1 chain
MPVTVDGVETLQTYLRSVLADAKHHAKDVDQVILALTGAIISRKDHDSDLEVHSGKGGGMGRALTVTIHGKRYAFSYSHDDHAIVMKEGSYQGPVLHKFTNVSSLADLDAIFKAL